MLHQTDNTKTSLTVQPDWVIACSARHQCLSTNFRCRMGGGYKRSASCPDAVAMPLPTC